MTRRLAQSTAYTVMLKVFLSSDHVTAATGKTVAVVISKAGGAFANPAAGATNATEVSNGWYSVALGTGDTGTLGDLIIRGTSASCDDTEQVTQVVSATTGGASNLDAASSTLATPTNITAGTITTVTNLTNAPTAGDLTATMKASVVAAVPAANANADALLDRTDGIESGFTMRQTNRLMASVLLGKVSGGGSGTETFRDLNDTKNRVVSTNTSVGNRTNVVKDAT